MTKRILITGASGLLGRELVKIFSKKKFFVMAQYHKHRPDLNTDCQWLKADFSSLKRIRDFTQAHQEKFQNCQYLINNYGPITHKEVGELAGQDFLHDFTGNVLTTVEITNFFIKYANLKSVVNIGFEFLGQKKAYKKILSYAAAKESLLLITKSFAEYFPEIRFNLVSPTTLSGAAVKLSTGKQISPRLVAREIFQIITSQKSGLNQIIK